MEQRLITLKEFSKYTGFGMTKCRELVKSKDNNFAVRLGAKYFIDVDRFEKELDRRIKYSIPF